MVVLLSINCFNFERNIFSMLITWLFHYYIYEKEKLSYSSDLPNCKRSFPTERVLHYHLIRHVNHTPSKIDRDILFREGNKRHSLPYECSGNTESNA